MNRKELLILLIEDDSSTCEHFTTCAKCMDDINLLGITNNSYRAIELVQNAYPDVVILDLELTQGKGNGLLFLQSLKKLDLPFKPYIVITTNNSSSATFEYARALGADFIMSKHQDDYSEEGVLQFLLMMKDIIQGNRSTNQPANLTTETEEQYRGRMTRAIHLHLDTIGISPKVVGYQYLTEAILLAVDGTTSNITKILGERYHKTNSSVERAMQNAINKAWRSGDIDELIHNYTARINSDKGVPTLTEFVFYYANLVKTRA